MGGLCSLGDACDATLWLSLIFARAQGRKGGEGGGGSSGDSGEGPEVSPLLLLPCYDPATGEVLPSPLTLQQAEALWDECVARAVGSAQRAHALAWFTQGVVALGSGSEERLLFSQEVACHLFATRLNTPSFPSCATTDAPAFMAWRVFFLYSSAASGHLRYNAGSIMSVAVSSKDAKAANAAFLSPLSFKPPTPTAAAAAAATPATPGAAALPH
jgi:hypothetical protein